ncbi:DUF2921 domain-containing protein [Cephalotus follicularis]|uniref:RING-type E3 ubiquitin transferase n=1 Tax=Cephalotus follicularis TaxID=3775 RepID=A0A1Q3BNA4_CEPFO|nr:DUF2921 domain-containing protein [Cephalotus follicularis]
MKGVAVAVLVWIVCGSLLISVTGSLFLDVDSGPTSESTVKYSYDRIDEVKKQCAVVLSSATELKPDDNRLYSIKEKLSFVDGDWRQDLGNSPILPFDDRETAKNLPNLRTTLKLVSFSVTDVDSSHRSKKLVIVDGLLSMGITHYGSFAKRLYGSDPHFQMWPSHTELSILFRGIYTETKKNERVMCLLGTAMLPSRESDSGDPWEWVKVSHTNYNQPPLLEDDQILLLLHYPMTFTLTNRVIKGEMRSLNPKSNLKYFDEVHILSQLGNAAHYQFGSEIFLSKACDPYPYQDSLMNVGIEIYKGPGFCDILQEATQLGGFTVVPNWRCNSTDEFCSKLGPFVSDKEIKATDGSFQGVKLYMQNVKCEQKHAHTNSSSAKVAAVLRVVSPLESQYSAEWRSGLSNMTLAAEGMWKSSSGQLCMVGCLGIVDAEGSTCDSRICLYIPISFSIKQRSVIVGSISSIDKSKESYFPLSFEKLVVPMELWNYFRTSHPYYSYSKLDSAGIVLEKNKPFTFGMVIKKSLLRFPKLEDTEDYISSLSFLWEDLTLHSSAILDPSFNSHPQRTVIQMEILSLGPLFGHYWYWKNLSLTGNESSFHNKAEYTEKQLLLNVSAQLTVSREAFSNFSVLFLEGLYDPHVGKMYLVGCRNVRASPNILFESMGLEAGLDCLIEVVVSYPPTTARWFVNPTARISIASQRTEDDPLHFSMIKLQTHPILYRKQREDILSRRGVEGILRIFTVSFAIACMFSQLFYFKHNAGSIPFMSLVMLGVQALGYSIPLITGAEAVFKRAGSESYETPAYNLEKNEWFQVIGYTVKLLVMVSFLLTLRLFQRVWKSRIRLLTGTPLEPHRIPSDKWVLVTTLITHVTGYTIVLIIHAAKTSQRPVRVVKFMNSTGNSPMLHGWETELEEYAGLVQDFFLLPQVIGNFIWQINCQPLRKLYFIGITVVRLLPHVYDYMRAPVPNPYLSQEYKFVNPTLDFYSGFGDISIPVTAALLAAVVYIQQKWDYEKLSQILTFGQYTLLPLGSRLYERLPLQSLEAELASGVNGNAAHDKEYDDDEE